MDNTVAKLIDDLSGEQDFHGWTGFNSPAVVELASGLWTTKAGARHFGSKGYEYNPAIQARHYEWVAVTSGSLSLEYDGKTQSIQEGMFYFMPDTTTMTCRTTGNPFLVWFEFAGPLCEHIGPLLSEQPETISTGRFSYGQINTVLQMAQLLQYHPPGYNLSVHSLLWRFISETGGSRSLLPKSYSPEIRRAVDFIHNAPLASMPGVEDIARAARMPVETFRKKFRAETGEAPLQHLLHFRIAKAKEMVANTELSIKQIALETGFSDPYYFSRLFKRYENVSPMAFRKRILV